MGSPLPQPSTSAKSASASWASKSNSKSSDTPTPPSEPPPKKRIRCAVVTVTDSEHSDNLPTTLTHKVNTATSKIYPKSVPKKKKNITVPSPDRRSDQTWSPTQPKKTLLHPLKKGPRLPSLNQANFTSTLMVRSKWQHKPLVRTWCSSGSKDKGPLTHSKYIDEEKTIMYNTASEDP